MKKILVLLMICSFAIGPAINAQQQDFGTLIFNHQIAIGMSFGNVQAAWGKPRTVDRSVYGDRVIEYWFYDNGYMVVFENGRATSFHK